MKEILENSQVCYKPTINGQLFLTKTRRRFNTFGIKFWLVSDSRNKYLVNGFLYLGMDEIRGPSIFLIEFIVTKLIHIILPHITYLLCGNSSYS